MLSPQDQSELCARRTLREFVHSHPSDLILTEVILLMKEMIDGGGIPIFRVACVSSDTSSDMMTSLSELLLRHPSTDWREQQCSLLNQSSS